MVGFYVFYDSFIILILLSHFLKFFEGRVVSEKVSGLSDDPETEFISGAMTSDSDRILITIRLLVPTNQPGRTSGEAICDTV